MQRGASIFRFGPWELDASRGELRFEGEVVEIRPKPLALIAHLLQHRDRFVPPADLLESCWPGIVVSESALHSAVKLARRSLREPGGGPSWIVSRRGRGYRFVGDVEIAGASAPAPRGAPEAAPPDLVGRAPQLRELDAALDAALAGAGQIALLRGEAGIGKTRLLAEVARRAAARGAIVVSGWCGEDGANPPFQPWLQILRALAHEAPQALDPHARAELVRLLPELAPAGGSGARADDDAPPEERRHRLLDAATRWLARAADARGLAVFVDDLHAADESSLGLFSHAARELASARVLLVAAERDPAGPRGRLLTSAVAVLARQPHYQLLALEGLDRAEVGELVATLAVAPPAPDVIDGIAERSRGNPFFVRALLHAQRLNGKGSVPPPLRDALRARLARLSERARAVLAAAGVIGREFDDATLAATLDCAPADLAGPLREAARAGFVEELPSGHGFEHAIVREMILAELPRAELMRLHARVADALAACEPGADPERVARHYAASGTGARRALFESSVEAGARAMQLLAFESACSHFERALAALALDPASGGSRRGALLLALARAHAGAGSSAHEVRGAVLASAELARDRGDLAALTLAALALELVPFAFPVPDADVLDLLEHVLARRGDLEDAVTVRLLCRLGHELVAASGSVDAGAVAALERHGHPAQHTERAVRIAERIQSKAALAMARWAQVPLALDQPPAVRAALAEDAATLADQAGRAAIAALARWQGFFALLALGEPALEERVDAFAASLDAIPLALGRPLLLQQRATLAFRTGDLDAAERALHEAQRLEERLQVRGFGAALAVALLLSQRERGATLEHRDSIARLFQTQPPMRILRLALADAELQLGDDAAARYQLDLVLADGLGSLPRDDRGPALRGLLAELAFALRDRELAAALLPELAAVAELQVVGFLGAVCLGSAARYAGLAAHAAGDVAAAAGFFRRAIEANEQSGATLWLAHSRLDYARLLQAGRRTEDRELAARMLERVGALVQGRPLGLLRERLRRARLEARGVTALHRKRA